MANPFVHLELCTSDSGKAKEFYSKLFGWNFTDSDMGGGMIYSTFKPDSGPGGGLFSMPNMPTFWMAYVGVDDINAATEKAKSLGASIHKGPAEIPQHRLVYHPRRSDWRNHRVVPTQVADVAGAPACFRSSSARRVSSPASGHLLETSCASERGLDQLVGAFAHLGSALQLVPVEGLAVNGALYRLEKHQRKQLPVSEALQPDME